jgi:hypothetical protein
VFQQSQEFGAQKDAQCGELRDKWIKAHEAIRQGQRYWRRKRLSSPGCGPTGGPRMRRFGWARSCLAQKEAQLRELRKKLSVLEVKV